MSRAIGVIAVLAAAIAGTKAMPYEENYPRTPVGVIEVKELPPARVLEAATTREGVARQDEAFMTLFRYIDQRELSMTVPVESSATPGRMRFFVERGHAAALPDAGGVTVYDRPAQRVVSAGLRGSYTEEAFAEGVARLRAWLAANPGYRATGEAYAVYWNGPFTPWFLRRSEVHIPVAPAAGASSGS